MSSEQNERSSAAPLCANNCGFYGNPANRNLCSKCYVEYLKTQAASAAPTAPTANTSSPGSASGQQTSLPFSSSPDKSASLATPSSCGSPSAADASTVTASAVCTPQATVGSDGTAGTSCAAVSSGGVSVEGNTQADVSSLHAKKEADAATSAEEACVSSSAAAATEPVDEKPKQIKTNRCWLCNKKVGLLGFQCRCGYFYCGEHRYADKHDCQFDYKTFEREQLRKHNNRVVADKLQKI